MYYDAGCYKIEQILVSDTFNNEFNITYLPIRVSKTFVIKNTQEYDDMIGGIHTFNRGKKMRFTFEWNSQDPQSDTFTNIEEQFTKLITILEQNKKIRIEFNSQCFNGIGYFEHINDDIVFYTQKEMFDNIVNGYGITINLGNDDYLYKIISSIQSGDLHYFTLDNIEEYDNMSVSGDVTYDINFIDCRVIKQDFELSQEPFCSILPTTQNMIFMGGSLSVEES